MSGIVALSLGGPVEPDERVVSAMLDRLRHRGPDGVDVVAGPRHLMAHFHFWTTPEEVGERQPVTDAETGSSLVFDGRIDNRKDLERSLGEEGQPVSSLSDARLLLRAYARWGRSCFDRLLGPFAVVIRDGRTGDLFAARDPMGDRTLHYASIPGGVAIASEEHALLAQPAIRSELDEETLARYFAIEAPRTGATFFKSIRELPAGSCLTASGGKVTVEAFWTPEPPDPIRYRTDEEYAEHLASVLGDAVESRLRSSTPVGVSLSGGMDSPSVAALAVDRLRRRGSPSRLASFSWVFDDLPECDERRWILPLVERLGLEASYVRADPHWPFRDIPTWPLNPNTPLSNPYRRLKQALYEAAARHGVRTLLVGVFSDGLFAGRHSWLASRIADGYWADAARHVVHLLRSRETRRVWRDPALRALLRVWLPEPRRTLRHGAKPEWLTPEAWKLAAGESSRPAGRGLSEIRTASVFSDLSRGEAGERVFSTRVPVDLRDPFRDLRVVRFMLAIPPGQLQRGSTTKYVLRTAGRGRLPDFIVERTERTPLDAFYWSSILGGEAETVRSLLLDPEALWRGRVDERWLLDGFPARFRETTGGRETLVPYFAAAAQLWRRMPAVSPRT